MSIKDEMKELESRGFNKFIKALVLLGIAFWFLLHFIPGNVVYEAPILNKIIGNVAILASVICFFVGDRLFGASKDPMDAHWKGDYATWVVLSVALMIIGMLTIAVFHGGPIGLNEPTV